MRNTFALLFLILPNIAPSEISIYSDPTPGTVAYGFKSVLPELYADAQSGDPESQFNLGDTIVGLASAEATDEQLKLGVAWLKAAANQNQLQAQAKLGRILIFDPRVQDLRTGFSLMAQSLQQGHVKAIIPLVETLALKNSPAYDPKLGYFWASVASSTKSEPVHYYGDAHKTFLREALDQTTKDELEVIALQCRDSKFRACMYDKLTEFPDTLCD